MKNLIFIVSISLAWNAVLGLNKTDDLNQNKTKRGLIDQTHYYGEPVTIKYIQAPILQDSSSASASNYNFNNPKPIVFQNSNQPIKAGIESETPKQVTVQQVLYEYQQTPHNAVSNVHVNQQFQSSPAIISEQKYVADPIQSAQTQINPHYSPHIIHSEPTQYAGVAAPVQHGTVIHHGQGYSKLLYGPFAVSPTTNPPLQHNGNTQAKYLFTNGKITYQPFPLNNHYPGIVLPARPQTLVTNINYQRPQQKPFKPSPLIPITYSRHQSHPKAQAKPTPSPSKEEVEEEEEDDKSNVREEQESEEESEPEDHSSYEAEEEEEEDFKPSYFSSKYKYNDDDDSDHDSYKEREEEEDEDTSRSSTRIVRKPKKIVRSESKPSKRYQKNDHYKFREGYKNKKQTEYVSPSETVKFESSGRKPKSQYKSYYYKSSNNSKPKKETIETRESEQVPVYHNKKFVHHEKWVVTKNESD